MINTALGVGAELHVRVPLNHTVQVINRSTVQKVHGHGLNCINLIPSLSYHSETVPKLLTAK